MLIFQSQLIRRRQNKCSKYRSAICMLKKLCGRDFNFFIVFDNKADASSNISHSIEQGLYKKGVLLFVIRYFSLFVCMLGMMTLLLLYFPTIFHLYVYAFFMLFCVEIFALSQWFLDMIILYVHSISISRFLMFIIYLLKLIISNIKMNLFIYLFLNFPFFVLLYKFYSFVVFTSSIFIYCSFIHITVYC